MTATHSERIDSNLIKSEEAKRRRNWDSNQRWRALQAMITWADSQSTVHRNTKEACLAKQQRLLAQFAAVHHRQT